MKVYFSDCTDGLCFTKPKRAFSMYISMWSPDNEEPNVYDKHSTNNRPVDCQKIMKQIQQIFPSLKIWSSDIPAPESPFYFDDIADEVAFILWSTDGFKIC